MSRTKVLTAGIFGLGLLMAACNSTDGGGAAITEADLQGKWTISTRHEKGTEKTTKAGATTTKNVDTTITMPAGSSIEFKADKTLAMTVGFPITGTWKLSGANTVTTIVSFLGMADTSDMTVSISGTQGTFVAHEVDTEDDGDEVIVTDIVSTTKATKQ